MTMLWQGKAAEVITDLKVEQKRIGLPEATTPEDDPREQLRGVLQLPNQIDLTTIRAQEGVS